MEGNFFLFAYVLLLYKMLFPLYFDILLNKVQIAYIFIAISEPINRLFVHLDDMRSKLIKLEIIILSETGITVWALVFAFDRWWDYVIRWRIF